MRPDCYALFSVTEHLPSKYKALGSVLTVCVWVYKCARVCMHDIGVRDVAHQ